MIDASTSDEIAILTDNWADNENRTKEAFLRLKTIHNKEVILSLAVC